MRTELTSAMAWVMRGAPNATHSAPGPRSLCCARVLSAIAAGSLTPGFKLVISSLHWLNICLVPRGE